MSNDKVLNETLDELTTLRDEMNTFRPLSKTQTKQLERNIRIEHVWSSNAIEGSSLNRYETASILDTGMTIHNVPLKDAMAAVDLNQAYDYMMNLVSEKQPLTITTIRDLNRLVMLKNTNEKSEAGAYRAIEVWPYGREDRHYTAPLDIPFEMDKLVKWANDAAINEHPVKYAADLHYRFVSIHPFIDGNGRTSRLLMNFALTEAGYPVINIQPDKTSRQEYMQALSHAQDTGDLLPFERLVANYVKKTLNNRLGILKQNEKNIEDARKQTLLFKPKPHER
ncbi:Fic family protein [uncultured Limosilactobacillus sp.]|uniref:Fic family protein n=1 Tax=uncultured Limosilactobacillus sp. TaxID=2837629 RepID=UPI0025CFA63B|nr:Fic family protein [uncultured Limosilactobacillus sp.]